MAASVVTCEGCPREFVPSRPNKRYHDKKCGDAARKARQRRRQRHGHGLGDVVLPDGVRLPFDVAEELVVEYAREVDELTKIELVVELGAALRRAAA